MLYPGARVWLVRVCHLGIRAYACPTCPHSVMSLQDVNYAIPPIGFTLISALCPSYRASRWEGPIITMLRQCAWGALRAARSGLQADVVAGNGCNLASAQASMPALSNLIRGFAAEPAPVQSASEGTVTQVRGIQVWECPIGSSACCSSCLQDRASRICRSTLSPAYTRCWIPHAHHHLSYPLLRAKQQLVQLFMIAEYIWHLQALSHLIRDRVSVHPRESLAAIGAGQVR